PRSRVLPCPAFPLSFRAVGDRSGGHDRVCRVLRVQRAVCDGSGSGARVCRVLHGPAPRRTWRSAAAPGGLPRSCWLGIPTRTAVAVADRALVHHRLQMTPTAFASSRPLEQPDLVSAPIRYPRPSVLRRPLEFDGAKARQAARALGLDTV